MNNNLIFAFDLGSGSIGICVRKGREILYLDSLLIDPEYASVKEAAKRRRQIRTRIAHKKREDWWNKEAEKAGIEVLSTAQPTKENPNLKPDVRMLIEFPSADTNDKTIYSSHLLRIALLQGVKLEGWQIFKAIRSAMQRRGYDASLPWAANAKETRKNKKDDEKENEEALTRYKEKLKEFFGDNEKYCYPCYYEAYKQSIWSPEDPKNLSGKLKENPAPSRNKDKSNSAVPSRELVHKELKALLVNAAQQFPKLKGREDYIIYGPAEEAYASCKNSKYFKHRGTEWDWQGLLGQKVPRFDNRIISKCRLIPRLNVCKADKSLNKEATFLLELKNMRYTSSKESTSKALSPSQINELFNKYKENFSSKEKPTKKALINTKEWKKYIEKLGGEVNPNQKEIPQPKLSGRSSFCKPALNILHGLILSGENSHDYHKKLVNTNKNTDSSKGLVQEDFNFLLNMPNDWDSISIPDTREIDKNLDKKQALEKIDKMISGISNRIVRHRLLMLKMKLEELSRDYGAPEKVIFEIAREDFISKKKKGEYDKFQNDNKKEKESAIENLKEAELNINAINILRARLYKKQKGEDIYDTSENRNIVISELDQYEIDHIVPRAQDGSDSLVNFILTKGKFNQDKGDLTPYEYFHKKRNTNDWDSYVKNVTKIFDSDKNNKTKIDLLISDKAVDTEKKKTDLQATSYIEKVAQRLTSLYFNFGMGTKDDKRRIQFFTGGETANVRSKLNLNKLLYSTDEEYNKAKEAGLKEKNRKNKRHHALDALVLSVLPEIKTKAKVIEDKPDYFDVKFCAEHLKTVVPKTIKQITPMVRETVYALRWRMEDEKKCYYFVSHYDSSIDNFKRLDPEKKNDKCARKNTDKIFDSKIRNDFKEKLKEEGLTQESWEKWLNRYTGNSKRIKKIAMIDSECFEEKDVVNPDGTLKEVIGEYGNKGAMLGQWIKGKKGHQGQIVYKDGGKWKVEPIYVFESVHDKYKNYKDKSNNVKFFKTGQNVELKKSYEGISAGIYKLRTIVTKGKNCKLENINDQKEITKNIDFFIENCEMTTYKK
jgi:CRISPR-associated endonuclease Csn1